MVAPDPFCSFGGMKTPTERFERHMHRAPIPEEEPLPGEDPSPDDEEPPPHPDPVIMQGLGEVNTTGWRGQYRANPLSAPQSNAGGAQC